MNVEDSQPYVEGEFSEQDRFFEKGISTEKFLEKLKKEDITVKKWVNNFPFQLGHHYFHTEEEFKEKFPKQAALQEIVIDKYKKKEEEYGITKEEALSKCTDVNWDEKMDYAILDVYIQMLEEGYPRYSESSDTLSLTK